MRKYKIGVAVEIFVREVVAQNSEEAQSRVWDTLPRELKDTHIETYEVEE